MNFAIGVDLGGTNLRIAAVSEKGDLLEKVSIATNVGRGRAAVIADMTEAIKEVAGRFGQAHRLLGVGIGVPGIIDTGTRMLRQSPNLPGWDDCQVCEEIEERLGAPVVLENDANVAAMGEAWLGAARETNSMCMITLGTGVGGGIVLGGQVWHGSIGMAGEVGHITVDPNGPACGCGNRGCVEQFASATAMVRMAREAIADGRAPELARAASSDAAFSARVIHNIALQGDPPAQEVFRKVGWALGLVIAALINTLNLDAYVIGGGAASAWPSFAPAMFEELRRRSFVYAAASRTLIVQASLGSDAGLYGAARLPMLSAARPLETAA